MGIETIAIASIAMAGLGTGMQVLGQLQQGKAKASSDRYNAQVADNNAAIAKQNQTWAAQAGEQKVAMQQQETRAKIGALRSSQGASGVKIGEGSGLDVLQSQSELGALDAMTIRSNAAREAYGYDAKINSFKAEKQLDEFSADNAETASYIGAGSTFLSGAGDASMSYAKGKTDGMFA